MPGRGFQKFQQGKGLAVNNFNDLLIIGRLFLYRNIDFFKGFAMDDLLCGRKANEKKACYKKEEGFHISGV